uniref:CxC2-like cysteine cluster KDZ transposase-associated domain-containing protein n=1 Tax=Moniliophthora roreri TaxID=221103 RepID=A0A0W0FE61_MONRR
MHTNGITDILVNFCFCSEHLDDFEQLLDLRLFPATVKRVETVFSFELLDEFHLHTLTNKKAVFDYYDALQHKTNLVLPQNAPNCYQLLIRVSHLHHHLAGKRRSGQSHGIDQYAPHRPENRTAVYCPACPEPNFNIDVQEIQNTPPEKRHKNTLYLAVDGCHSAQCLKKVKIQTMLHSMRGLPILAHVISFEIISKRIPENLTYESSLILKAVRMQNILKFKNAVITGIVSAICTQHGLFLPNGVVDMPKGEMFCLGDWVLYHALLGREDLHHVHLSYDLWCIFKVHLPDRLKCWPTQFSDQNVIRLLSEARSCIPQLHIKGHGHMCKACYHFEYTCHVGRTNRELVKTPWSSEKLTGGSTHYMNNGHRHNTLDDFHRFWNFCKVQKLGATLERQWAQAQLATEDLQPQFDEFTQLFPPDTLEE